ncbi:MAG: PhzF family phenazine biosynthesis protein [Paracoccaceae bacterium]
MRFARSAPSDVMEPYLVTLGGVTDAGDTFSRLLLAPPLPAEDPFTGSATGSMAAYLWSEGLIDDASFTAEQGHWMGRPGQARVSRIGTAGDIAGVRVGGQGYVLMRGFLNLG